VPAAAAASGVEARRARFGGGGPATVVANQAKRGGGLGSPSAWELCRMEAEEADHKTAATMAHTMAVCTRRLVLR
jgi:hypothetical protein